MLFADPGTYLYHCDLTSRNDFRKTFNHNTLCIEGQNQSEMLGAFLWGKKAQCRLLECKMGEEEEIVEAEHDGYSPTIHKRRFVWNKTTKILKIEDKLSSPRPWTLTFVVGAKCRVEKDKESYLVEREHAKCMISLPEGCTTEISEIEISEAYGEKVISHAVRAYGNTTSFSTVITII